MYEKYKIFLSQNIDCEHTTDTERKHSMQSSRRRQRRLCYISWSDLYIYLYELSIHI
jgi:prophage antirepressor-like protein